MEYTTYQLVQDFFHQQQEFLFTIKSRFNKTADVTFAPNILYATDSGSVVQTPPTKMCNKQYIYNLGVATSQ